MKTHGVSWIAGLVAAGFVAAAPAVALSAESLRLHPEELRASSTSRAPSDLELTRKIRSALVASDALTNLGKNVAIDTREGNVTLSGTVTNLRERTLVGDIAIRVAGSGRVENDLEFLYVS